MGFLTDVVTQVRRDLDALPLQEGSLLLRTHAVAPARDFGAALLGGEAIAVIAEVKRASPSAGAIADVEPADQALRYERGGAAAISVLTEPRHFGGSLADLRSVRMRSSLPLLRKDFIVHPGQVLQSRVEGADAVLLIAAALTESELEELRTMAEELGMSALVEVHSDEGLARAVSSGAGIVGVNARDLETLEVDRERALRLAGDVPAGRTVVLESGVRTREDVARAEAAGARAVLVGETLMRAADPAAAVRELLGR